MDGDLPGECQSQLIPLKSQYPWLKDINAQALQIAVHNLGTAFDRFYKNLGSHPRFKKKNDRNQSFSVPQNFELCGNKLFIPKLKDGIKMVQHRPLNGKPKSLTISKVPSGKYYVSVICELEDPKTLPKIEVTIGADVGVSRLVTTSHGEIIDNPRFGEKSKKALRRSQRALSRKRKGSKNWNKSRLRVAKLHEHVSCQRADYLHKVSKRLIEENQFICLEDLNVAGMLRNHKLARVIADAGLGELKRQILYKAEDAGRTVVEADRWFASSKICSVCGYLHQDLELSDRYWTCPVCGTVHDRDVNAAKNLEQEGIRQLNGIAGLCENLPRTRGKRLPAPWSRRSSGLDPGPERLGARGQSLKQESIGSVLNA